MQKKERTGPSTTELKLRSDLDRVRRELDKLRKVPAAADASAELERLRAQVVELTATRTRLSRLYFTQVEEGRRRSARQQRFCERLTDVRAGSDGPLEQLVALVRETLGFEAAMVHGRAGRQDAGEQLTVCAAAGKPPAELARSLAAAGVFRGLGGPVAHGRARRVRISALASPAAGQGDVDESPLEWSPNEVLAIPMLDREGSLQWLLTAAGPEAGAMPASDVVQLLELAAAHLFGLEGRHLPAPHGGTPGTPAGRTPPAGPATGPDSALKAQDIVADTAVAGSTGPLDPAVPVLERGAGPHGQHAPAPAETPGAATLARR